MDTLVKPKQEGTRNERALLSVLQPYDVLPANYLHAGFGREPEAERLVTSCKAKGFIQEYDFLHDYKYVIPRLLEYGPRAASLGFTQKRTENEHTEHKWARCITKFSFDHTSFSKISFDVPTLDTGTFSIEPDIPLFGLESEHRKFFLVGEIDRGTQTRDPDQENESAFFKKNITQMVTRYAAFMDDKLYKDYGIPNIAVFIVATDRKKRRAGSSMQSIAKVIKKHVDAKFWPNFLLTNIPDFEIIGRPILDANGQVQFYKDGCKFCADGLGHKIRTQAPPPTDHMVTRGWLRVGDKEPFIIADFLERRRQWTS